MKATVTIIKGTDAYVQMTALSEYCRQQGWVIIEESVTIEMPIGKKQKQFDKDVISGKIRIVK